jgi:hypothetical protein
MNFIFKLLFDFFVKKTTECINWLFFYFFWFAINLLRRDISNFLRKNNISLFFLSYLRYFLILNLDRLILGLINSFTRQLLVQIFTNLRLWLFLNRWFLLFSSTSSWLSYLLTLFIWRRRYTRFKKISRDSLISPINKQSFLFNTKSMKLLLSYIGILNTTKLNICLAMIFVQDHRINLSISRENHYQILLCSLNRYILYIQSILMNMLLHY